MSYAVNQKTRELGMRIALGATTADILRLVLSRYFGLVSVGILIGAGITLELKRLIASLLFKVSPRDPVAFGSALLVMSVTALVALWVPAQRAAGIDQKARPRTTWARGRQPVQLQSDYRRSRQTAKSILLRSRSWCSL
jgi:hypothetical protein